MALRKDVKGLGVPWEDQHRETDDEGDRGDG